MDKLCYKHLKSGTDVRGTAVGEAYTLTDGAVENICRAFVRWLSLKYGKTNFKIAVGHDSRISAERITESVIRAIVKSGCDAVYTGLSTTPSMFILLKKSDFGCDASVMITASHLPYDRNGLKFFTPDGGLDGRDIDDILDIAEGGEFPSGEGSRCSRSFMDEYSEILVRTVRGFSGKERPLEGKKIIVDAGNGAGGFFTERVLKPLGADTEGSQFLEPDGRFPNHIPNPEDKGAIESLCAAVKKTRADLGIIFDTDVDRAGAVDASGKEINRNRLIALVSAILLKDRPGVIVTDSVTSDGLTQFIEGLGGKHVRFKRGYKNVIDKCRELNESGTYSPLAAETSGHAAFMENYFLDDGAYLITKLLVSLSLLRNGESLADLIKDLPEPVESDEVRITFNSSSTDFRSEGKRVIEELKAFASSSEAMRLAAENYEGARISFGKDDGDGWLLLRMSVHDPVMPINIESDTAGGSLAMAKTLLSFLSAYPFLDLKNLADYIKK